MPWTRDYTRAFADAEEQRRPLLLFFRERLRRAATGPQNPIAAGGPIEHQEGLVRLRPHAAGRLGERRTSSRPPSASLPVLVDGGDRTLQVRYQAVRMPTTLVTDPWGNEVFRASGYFAARQDAAQILAAVPADFAPLAAAGTDPEGATPRTSRALVAAAQFYEGAGLPQVGERLYASALAAPAAGDAVARGGRRVISRGLNLMARLNRAGGGGRAVREGAGRRPRRPGSDALLLGLVNARLSQGRRKEAEAALKQMEAKFAASPYTARARENLAAAKK